MQVEGFFEWLGQAIGSVIRFIVDGLYWILGMLAGASQNFVDGLATTLGMDRSLLTIAALVIGLMLLVGAFRAFFRRSIISGLILLILGLWLLSLIIH
ncbi:hypothetical protein [Pseudomonas matsuisoli]|jgi:Na+/pantothenate symporter|uniref:Uncharacterized protein n=1 Tax=Pseudomonas matsuisoli TaxID=1515666 RepID=A0A917PXJ3_9PSED|nr:hypothetical protein [Pseudomonas matsuisoli]GGJ97705.1 hypothetical protein GCM10009304_24500 [Pseudomonas matsuisoli]